MKGISRAFDKTLNSHLSCFKTLDSLSVPVEAAAGTLVSALKDGRKLLVCGNGGSAADAQHFAAELVGRFTRERQPWPAIALTTDTSILTAVANDYGYDHIFSRQVEGLGQPRDVLIAISTSGHSENVLRAVRQAISRNMHTIALTGGDGGELVEMADICIQVPSDVTARIQEAHIFILHFWADTAEAALLAGEDA